MPTPPAAPTLPPEVVARLSAPLDPVDAALAARHPGTGTGRQPVHTCYLPADRMRPDLVPAWAARAGELLAAHGGDPARLAAATGGDPAPDRAAAVHAHVLRALATEPIQDLRVDLEDGYGSRPDETEDADAVRAAEAVLAAAGAGTLPTRYGLRPKSLDPTVRVRGLRSLDLFLTTLATTLATGGGVPPGLVLTLPKVSDPAQLRVFDAIVTELEQRLHLPPIGIEVQVETPAAVLALPELVRVGLTLGPGRLVGLHVGTYDYSAALGISAADQASDHPAVEYATALMQLVAAGTGIQVADGSSNLLPIDATEQPGTGGADVHQAWRRHAELIRRAWHRGLYQGWDLHPGQLVSRHAAVAGCLLTGLDDAIARLAAYATAHQSGTIVDEPATGRALAGHVLRALDAGLLDDDNLAAAGLRRDLVGRLSGRAAPVGS
ncbi:aldolase/citrate lyase family protein [Frankia sp. AgB32]|uniref:DUF6986 family protein n=1 Tax=Frankia sp. AgB32 TaxID=631119 RepID=UPI00200F651F|nr:aldolase/citrate lyase family protein [Frankia sp. AgB32]MCK9893356.1 aldolase/citrate lyase family protein [Frankia sp. AgB32]